MRTERLFLRELLSGMWLTVLILHNWFYWNAWKPPFFFFKSELALAGKKIQWNNSLHSIRHCHHDRNLLSNSIQTVTATPLQGAGEKREGEIAQLDIRAVSRQAQPCSMGSCKHICSTTYCACRCSLHCKGTLPMCAMLLFFSCRFFWPLNSQGSKNPMGKKKMWSSSWWFWAQEGWGCRGWSWRLKISGRGGRQGQVAGRKRGFQLVQCLLCYPQATWRDDVHDDKTMLHAFAHEKDATVVGFPCVFLHVQPWC